MIRWVKKGTLRLAGRLIQPGEVFPKTLLDAVRLAEFIDHGWVEFLVDDVVIPILEEELPSVVVRAKPQPAKSVPDAQEVENERQKEKREPRKRRGRTKKRRSE